MLRRAVQSVADRHIVRGDRLRNRPRGITHLEEPARHLRSRADLRECAEAVEVEIDLPGLLRGGGRLVHISEIFAGDAQLLHHGIQSRPVQSETRGGGGDHPAALLQHADNMIPLHLLEGGAPGGLRGVFSDLG
jgi:hypothetical protein